MAGVVQIEGLAELRAALRQAGDGSVREVTAALKEGAQEITAMAVGLAPRGETGRLAASGKAWATQKSAGVKFSAPYAGVQEFARTYRRRTPSGSTTVHMVNVSGAVPRFAFRAIDVLGPAQIEKTFDRLTEVLRCHGWFEG